MLKNFFAVVLAVLMLTFACGCSKMPFNGNIEFHDISLTVPERFIRDSTQSTSDLWVFEHDNYSEYILISKKDITGDIFASLDNYVDYMKENNADSQRTSFLNNDAVLSLYYNDGVFCQEILFAYNNSFYAVALRGGTEEGFKEITDTVKIIIL